MSENVRNFEIDAKQARALGVLLSGGDATAAARAADITTRQLLRWRGEPQFAQALAAGRAAVLEDAGMRAAALAVAALNALGEIVADKTAGAADRIRAAGVLLNAVLPLTGEVDRAARVAHINSVVPGN